MMTDLTTTNVFLGIIAAVSLLQVLGFLAIVAGVLLIYRRVLRVVAGVEERQVAPAMGRVNAILDNVKDVTTKIKNRTGRIDALIEYALASFPFRHGPIPPAGPM